ncbi:glycosyltransferase [Cavenderia fasciculata]|uniref:GDP-Man:Man(3)GlcNAc(2)-PP-Dol alpha-1,2-mannosyltransferase n=1 Tax=Cavenderia fasciculata TaxID=261658 RepID=F4QE30_CACFS|nr:glycosyltransferase [Cavenderia fasciculata]EGG13977.1 glycosyltransferase [Cavenderia fasciculata]|eukprot:XP_004350685.1 glycosyltransferase [Cavenderia fasciculata]
MISCIVSSCLYIVGTLIGVVAGLVLLTRLYYQSKRPSTYTIGFFHPYCAAGGGGERVLWCAVKAIQESYPDANCLVYTGDTISDDEIFNKINNTFMIELKRKNIEFIRLTKRKYVEDSLYPVFTLLGQSLGSMILGMEALSKCNPHVYIDTMGYAFTYPIFRILGGSKVACYVHYPIVSSDMIVKVANQQNLTLKRKIFSNVKLVYYKIFAIIYRLVGNLSQLVFVNGTWTGNHISTLWKRTFKKDVILLYPPVDVSSRIALPLNWQKRKNMVLSIAQFRPEKDHMLQLLTLDHLLKTHPQHKKDLELVMVGSCRGEEDRGRVEQLEKKIKELGLEKNVRICVGVSAQELNDLFAQASVGIHTMWCEHFGIGVVELMAGGLIPVAHDSAGPKEDIVLPGTGFLATTKEQYANYIHEIIANKPKYADMQKAARESTNRFSETTFIQQFKNHIKLIIDYKSKNIKKDQ